MFGKMLKKFAIATVLGVMAMTSLIPVTASAYSYTGANGQVYNDSHFNFNNGNSIYVANNQGQARFCWSAPKRSGHSMKYDGFAVYANVGRSLGNISNTTPTYTSSTCYTYPQKFTYNTKVNVRVYPYLQLKGGAKKYLQPGYKTSAFVKGVAAPAPTPQPAPQPIPQPQPAPQPVPYYSPLSLSVTGWNDGLPKISWTKYKGSFSGYQIIVAEGKLSKNVTLNKPGFYVSKYTSTRQLQKMKASTNYSIVVAPYKWSNGHKRTIRGAASNVMHVKTAANQPVIPVPQKDSIKLYTSSWNNGMPTLNWTKYNDQFYSGYALFLREGTWDKHKVTHVSDQEYISKYVHYKSLKNLKSYTKYSARIIPYKNKAYSKEFIYPASNVLHFTTGNTNPTPQVVVSCGNSAGGDGEYSACKGDTIKHSSGTNLRVDAYTNNYVKIKLSGAANYTTYVYKNAIKTIYLNGGKKLQLKYTQTSPKYGAFVKVNTVQTTPPVVMSCGNSAGGDGLYSACKHDTIKHSSGLNVRVDSYTQSYVKAKLSGATNYTTYLYKNSPKTVYLNGGAKVQLKYTDTTPKHGAFIQVSTLATAKPTGYFKGAFRVDSPSLKVGSTVEYKKHDDSTAIMPKVVMPDYSNLLIDEEVDFELLLCTNAYATKCGTIRSHDRVYTLFSGDFYPRVTKHEVFEALQDMGFPNQSFFYITAKLTDMNGKVLKTSSNKHFIFKPVGTSSNLPKPHLTITTGQAGKASLDWQDIAGLGSTFDKYHIKWKKGWYTNLDNVSHAKSYVSYGSYYNLVGLDSGWWTFQVVPTKNKQEVGPRSTVIRVYVK